MPRRSKVFGLPPALRDELDARLVGSGFQNIEGLAEWLNQQGYQLSKSAIGRYSLDLKEEFEESMSEARRFAQLARAHAANDPDEQGSLLDGIVRSQHEMLMRVQLQLRKAEMEPGEKAHHMAKISRAIANLGRVSIAQKKWAAEVGARLQAASENVERIARKGGLSDDTIKQIRGQLMGIV